MPFILDIKRFVPNHSVARKYISYQHKEMTLHSMYDGKYEESLSEVRSRLNERYNAPRRYGKVCFFCKSFPSASNSIYCTGCGPDFKKEVSLLKKKYGPPDQSQRCEICSRSNGNRALCLDHCHYTGKARGWLCDHCNKGISILDNHPERFHSFLENLPSDAEMFRRRFPSFHKEPEPVKLSPREQLKKARQEEEDELLKRGLWDSSTYEFANYYGEMTLARERAGVGQGFG